MIYIILILSVLLLLCVVPAAGESKEESGKPYPDSLKAPVMEGIWVRPASGGNAEPVIGFKNGIRIALWPINDPPRGLIRIHAPFVLPDSKHPLLNFIAIEPVVKGRRSYSELERSLLDNAPGKRMWFSDGLSDSPSPKLPWNPSRGKLGKIKVGSMTVETLTIVVNVEKLDNGASPSILVTFRADRPNEVGFKTYANKGSEPMESCVLTATMGNYSRTRLLWLKDEVVDSRKVWPDYKGSDFVWTSDYPGERVRKDPDGTLTVAITPNEKDLSGAQIPPGGWPFKGLVSTQYWRKYPGTAKADLRVRVNGRAVYYGTQALIPGGVAFENFETIEKFEPGSEVWYGVTLQTPREMGWPL